MKFKHNASESRRNIVTLFCREDPSPMNVEDSTEFSNLKKNCYISFYFLAGTQRFIRAGFYVSPAEFSNLKNL